MIGSILYTETSILHKLTLCDNQADGRFLGTSLCVTEYILYRKYAIADPYMSQGIFSEDTVFAVHTLFLQD